jgi:hypothetical protein
VQRGWGLRRPANSSPQRLPSGLPPILRPAQLAPVGSRRQQSVVRCWLPANGVPDVRGGPPRRLRYSARRYNRPRRRPPRRQAPTRPLPTRRQARRRPYAPAPARRQATATSRRLQQIVYASYGPPRRSFDCRTRYRQQSGRKVEIVAPHSCKAADTQVPAGRQ